MAISRNEAERVVRMSFLVDDEIAGSRKPTLVAQLSGRSANLFLVDEAGCITYAWREPKGAGQQIGEAYQPPRQQRSNVQEGIRKADEIPLALGNFSSLSAAADDYYTRREHEAAFAARSKSLLDSLQREIHQKLKLKTNLTRDLVTHGDPDQMKRTGDLLLANISNARREGTTVTLIDYYSEGAPEIVVEVDENKSLQDEAARYFSRYTKAKRAAEEIATRLAHLEREIPELLERRVELERIVSTRDEERLPSLKGSKAPPPGERERKSNLTSYREFGVTGHRMVMKYLWAELRALTIN